MSSDIVGSIKLKTMLSGMPELRLGLNDRVLFALTGRKYQPFLNTLFEFIRSVVQDEVSPGNNMLCVCRRQREDCYHGGCEVSSVCPSVAFREWPNHLLHPTWRRVRAHVISYQHTCKAPAPAHQCLGWTTILTDMFDLNCPLRTIAANWIGSEVNSLFYFLVVHE